MAGYFLVCRGLHKHQLFESSLPFSKYEAWVDTIEQANFAPSVFRNKSQFIEISRGSFATSYRALARRWRWSVNRVRRETDLWKKQNMIDLKTDLGMVQITLCNYELYQNPWNTDGTATEQQRNSNGTLTDTNQKKEKKEKEGKEYKVGFEEIWIAYPTLNRPKGSKKKALDAYKVALTKTDHETIMKGINDYAACLRFTGQSNADFFRWLQDERWGDDYTYTVGGNGIQPQRGQPTSKFAQGLAGIEAARAKRLAREQEQAG